MWQSWDSAQASRLQSLSSQPLKHCGLLSNFYFSEPHSSARVDAGRLPQPGPIRGLDTGVCRLLCQVLPVAGPASEHRAPAPSFNPLTAAPPTPPTPASEPCSCSVCPACSRPSTTSRGRSEVGASPPTAGLPENGNPPLPQSPPLAAPRPRPLPAGPVPLTLLRDPRWRLEGRPFS